METIIKVSPSELNGKLLAKIKEFIGKEENVDITISLKEMDGKFSEQLNKSLLQAEDSSNLISFTMEDFMAYQPTLKE